MNIKHEEINAQNNDSVMGNIQDTLGGSGHFAFGFVFGYVIMHLFLKFRYNKLSTHLYAPLIPILAGIWAVIPYPFYESATVLADWLNIFLFYPTLHFNDYLISVLGRAAFAVLIIGFLFGLIVLRYIRLYKYCKNYGWSEDNEVKNA